MKLLVTGGAGFIGSHYVRMLLDGRCPGFESVKVTVLDKLTYAGRRDNLPAVHPRLEFVQGDVASASLLRDLLPGHDAVVHFAAESHVDRSINGGAEFVRTNVLGTQTLLDECLRQGVQPVVCVSTDEVYGSLVEGAWTEDQPLQPNSLYAAAKAGGDLLARSYWRTHELDVRVTRCCNNYGPYQHVEKLIPLFVTNLFRDIPVPLYGDGRNVREWLHVEDHCQAIQLVLTKGMAGEIYNIGGGARLSNAEVTVRLLDLCGADHSMIRYVEDRKGHDLGYALDDTKIRTELGYRPTIDFEDGLPAVVAWYRANSGWWSSLVR